MDLSSIPKDFDFDLNLLSLHKMLFIYNAVLNGWTVKKLPNNKFEFKKHKDDVKKELYLDTYLDHFTKSNLNIDHIINNNENK